MIEKRRALGKGLLNLVNQFLGEVNFSLLLIWTLTLRRSVYVELCTDTAGLAWRSLLIRIFGSRSTNRVELYERCLTVKISHTFLVQGGSWERFGTYCRRLKSASSNASYTLRVLGLSADYIYCSEGFGQSMGNRL